MVATTATAHMPAATKNVVGRLPDQHAECEERENRKSLAEHESEALALGGVVVARPVGDEMDQAEIGERVIAQRLQRTAPAATG